MKRSKYQRFIGHTLVALGFVAIVNLSACRTAPPARPDSAPIVTIDNTTGYCQVRWGKRGGYTMAGQAIQLDDSSYTVSLEQFDWFNNWKNGWTEATVPLEGTLLLVHAQKNWNVSTLEKPIPAQTLKAQIRYRDTIIEGNQAKETFDRRIQRIQAVASWLAADTSFAPSDGNSFTLLAGKLLFPEEYGYTSGYAHNAENADFVSGEGMKWNRSYSNVSIPPHLCDVRNSGTLWRDWEESRELFYITYLWEKY